MGLLPNFVAFFNDNVLTMCLACSYGFLGSTLIGNGISSPTLSAFLGLLINLGLIFGTRLVLICVYNNGAPDGTARKATGHLIGQLAWMVRVPSYGFAVALLDDLWDEIEYDDDMGPPVGQLYVGGEAFLIGIGITLGWGVVMVLVHKLFMHRPDKGSTDQSWLTFFLELCYLCCLTNTSKMIHETLHVITTQMRGPDSMGTASTKHLYAAIGEQGVETLLAFWYLHFIVPALDRSVTVLPDLKDGHKYKLTLSSSTLQGRLVAVSWNENLCVYVWSFSFVNALWEIFYDYIGYRTNYGLAQGLFWILCICVTAVVILIAKFNSPNGDDFYYINKDKGLQRNMLSTVNIMCYWTVDFMVWWGWYQIVVSIDADAAPKAGAMINQSPKIIGLNVGLIVILFILIMALSVWAELADTMRISGPPFRASSSKPGSEQGDPVVIKEARKAEDVSVTTTSAQVDAQA